jgi:hypothetical protein
MKCVWWVNRSSKLWNVPENIHKLMLSAFGAEQELMHIDMHGCLQATVKLGQSASLSCISNPSS